MRESPSIIPWGDLDRTVHLVLDDLGGKYGWSWSETSIADTDRATLIRRLLEGQYSEPVRIVAFNTAEGWSRDVRDEIAVPIFGASRMYAPEQIMTAIMSAPDTFYIFRWDRHGRKGERCLVLARGTMNSCLVRFEDGYMMVTSRNALGIKVPFNPTVATQTASAALAFAKCGITIRHSELPVVVPLAGLMTA